MPVDETRQAAYEDLVARGYFKRNPDKQAFADELISRGYLRRPAGTPAPTPTPSAAAPTPAATTALPVTPGRGDYHVIKSDTRNPVQKFFGNLFGDLASGGEDLKEKIATPRPVFEHPKDAGEWAQNAITSLPLQPLHFLAGMGMIPQTAADLAGNISSQNSIANNQASMEKVGLSAPGGASATRQGIKQSAIEGAAGLVPAPLVGEAATLATKGPESAWNQLSNRALTDPGSFLVDALIGKDVAHGVKNSVQAIKTPRAKTTVYGYKGDPNGDSYTQAGLGAWGNKLREGSIALSRDLEAQLKAQGVTPKSKIAVQVKGPDGKPQVIEGFWDDRTAETYKGKRLEGRVDFYRPDGNTSGVDGLQVMNILTEGNKPISTKSANNSYRGMTRDMADLHLSDLLAPHPAGREASAYNGSFEPQQNPFMPTQAPPLGIEARQPLALPAPTPEAGLQRGADGTFYGPGFPQPFSMNSEPLRRAPEVLGQVPLDSNPEGLVPQGFTRPLIDVPAPRPAFRNTLGDVAGRANRIPASEASKVPSSLFRNYYQEESAPGASAAEDAPSRRVVSSVRKKPTMTSRRVVVNKSEPPAPITAPTPEPKPIATTEPKPVIAPAPEPKPEPPRPQIEPEPQDVGMKARTISNGNPDIGKTAIWKFTKTQKQGKPFKIIESGVHPNGQKWYSLDVPGRGGVHVYDNDPRFGGIAEDAPAPTLKPEPPTPEIGKAPATSFDAADIDRELEKVNDEIPWARKEVAARANIGSQEYRQQAIDALDRLIKKRDDLVRQKSLPSTTIGKAPAASAETLESVRRSLRPIQEMLDNTPGVAAKRDFLERTFKSTASLKGKLTPEQQKALIDEMVSGTEVPQPHPTEGPSAPQKETAPKPGDVVNVLRGKNATTGEPVYARAIVHSRNRKTGRYTLKILSPDGVTESRFTAPPEEVSLWERTKTEKAKPEASEPRTVKSGKHTVDIGEDISVTHNGEEVRATAESKKLIRKIAGNGGSDDAIAAIAKSQGSEHADGTLVRVPGEGSTPVEPVWTYAVRGKLKRGGAATRQVTLDQPEWVKEVWEAAGNKTELRKPAEVVHNNEITSIGDSSTASKKQAAEAWRERNTPADLLAKLKEEQPKAERDAFKDNAGRKDTILPDKTPIRLVPGAEVKVRFYRFPKPKKGPTFEESASIDHVEVPFKVYAFPKDAPGSVILRVSEDTVIRPHNISKTKDVIIPEGTQYILKVPTRRNKTAPWAAEPRISTDEIPMDAVTSIQVGPDKKIIMKGVSNLKPDSEFLTSVERKAPARDRIVSKAVEKVNEVREKGCP